MPPRGYRKRSPTISPSELVEIPHRRWEHMTLSSERPLSKPDYDVFGADGWELTSVYVRMDAVHAVFKREVVG